MCLDHMVQGGQATPSGGAGQTAKGVGPLGPIDILDPPLAMYTLLSA